MQAVNNERFGCNELSGLPRPDDGGAGLCVIAEINRLAGRTQGCTDPSPVGYGRHLWVRVEKATTVRRLLRIWLDFPSLR